MTWTFLGKSNSYSDNDGVQISVQLSTSNEIGANSYKNALADIVRQKTISRIVIDGTAIFSEKNFEYVAEILSFAKSLRLPTILVANAPAENKYFNELKSLLDVDTTCIAVELDANAAHDQTVIDGFKKMIVSALSQQDIIGYAHVNNFDEAVSVFKAMQSLGIKDIVADVSERDFIKKAALPYDIKISECQPSAIMITEQNGAVTSSIPEQEEKVCA